MKTISIDEILTKCETMPQDARDELYRLPGSISIEAEVIDDRDYLDGMNPVMKTWVNRLGLTWDDDNVYLAYDDALDAIEFMSEAIFLAFETSGQTTKTQAVEIASNTMLRLAGVTSDDDLNSTYLQTAIAMIRLAL